MQGVPVARNQHGDCAVRPPLRVHDVFKIALKQMPDLPRPYQVNSADV